MRKAASILIGLVALLGASRAWATPTTMSFTGRLSDNAGPVTGSVDLQFRLFTVASGGTAVWSEDHSGTGAQNGLVFVELGQLTPLDPSVFDGSQLFLEVQVGTDILTPRTPVDAVAYAERAAVADSADTLGTIQPGDVVTAVTGSNGVTATKTGNSVAIGITTGTYLPAGSTVACTGTNKVTGIDPTTGNVVCGADANSGGTITGVTAGAGLTGGGTSGAVTVALSTCAAGQVLQENSSGTGYACASTGTITGVTAGNGLSGGGTSGAVSLALAACAANQHLVENASGTGYICAASNAGTITGVTAGAGLTGGGTSGAVTVSIAAGGVGPTQLAPCATNQVYKYNGTSWVCSTAPPPTCTQRASAATALSSWYTYIGASCNVGETAISGGWGISNWNTANTCIPIESHVTGGTTQGWTVTWGSPTQTGCSANSAITYVMCCS